MISKKKIITFKLSSKGNVLVMASEVGVYDVDPKDVLLKVGKENLLS